MVPISEWDAGGRGLFLRARAPKQKTRTLPMRGLRLGNRERFYSRASGFEPLENPRTHISDFVIVTVKIRVLWRIEHDVLNRVDILGCGQEFQHRQRWPPKAIIGNRTFGFVGQHVALR